MMTIGELLVQTLATSAAPVVPDTEINIAERYWTYRVSYVPVEFGDNSTDTFNCVTTVTYCCPLSDDPMPVVLNASRALVSVGFTRGSITDLTSGKLQQWSISTQIVGWDDGTAIRV